MSSLLLVWRRDRSSFWRRFDSESGWQDRNRQCSLGWGGGPAQEPRGHCGTFLGVSLEGELGQASEGALGAMAPGAQGREGWWELLLQQWRPPGAWLCQLGLRGCAEQGSPQRVCLGVVMDPAHPAPDPAPGDWGLSVMCS